MYSEHQKTRLSYWLMLEGKVEDLMIQFIAGTCVEINPEGSSL